MNKPKEALAGLGEGEVGVPKLGRAHTPPPGSKVSGIPSPLLTLVTMLVL